MHVVRAHPTVERERDAKTGDGRRQAPAPQPLLQPVVRLALRLRARRYRRDLLWRR